MWWDSDTEMTYKGKHGEVHILIYGLYLDSKYLRLTPEQAKNVMPVLMQYPHRVWVTVGDDVTYTEASPWGKTDSILANALTLENVEQYFKERDYLKQLLSVYVKENEHQRALARRRELRRLKKEGGQKL